MDPFRRPATAKNVFLRGAMTGMYSKRRTHCVRGPTMTSSGVCARTIASAGAAAGAKRLRALRPPCGSADAVYVLASHIGGYAGDVCAVECELLVGAAFSRQGVQLLRT